MSTGDAGSLPAALDRVSRDVRRVLAHALAGCEDIVADVKTIRDDVQRKLVELLPKEGEYVDGVGQLVKRSGWKRANWEGRALAHVVAARAAEEPPEDAPRGAVAGAVADAIISCSGLDNGSHSWRQGELKRRNIDPGQYCEWSASSPSVQLVR